MFFHLIPVKPLYRGVQILIFLLQCSFLPRVAMDTNFSRRWIGKFRLLALLLIFSGALNIGLITAFVAMLLKDKETNFSFARPSKGEARIESTNGALISALSKLSFRELCAYLTNREPVEEGYLKRDLALAVLVSSRHFDLERALSGSLNQRRTLTWGGDQTIEMYPGLCEDQFKAIIQFVYLEKWPLTPEGLFKLVQKGLKPQDDSLLEAFVLTPQFHALQVLFQKTEVPQDRSVLIELAAEGSWDLLDRLAKEQTQLLDLSVEKRRRLLLSYLSLRSPTAAKILVATDFSFALKRLNDQGIVDLLDLLQGDEANRLCLELLKSPRSDAVWERSAAILYANVNEPVPVPFDHNIALSRFVSGERAPIAAAPALVVQTVPSFAPWIIHTVKEGESLWKIARQYKVKPDAIAQANELEKDRIFPGMTLRIPQ